MEALLLLRHLLDLQTMLCSQNECKIVILFFHDSLSLDVFATKQPGYKSLPSCFSRIFHGSSDYALQHIYSERHLLSVGHDTPNKRKQGYYKSHKFVNT